MKILGFDPGVKNFGIAIYDSKKDYIKFDMMKNMPCKGKSSDLDFKKFRKHLLKYIININPKILLVENYQARGGFGQTEICNRMIGSIETICDFLNIKFISYTPSQWKTFVKRQNIDLNTLYKKWKDIVQPHNIDALHMIYTYFMKNSKTVKIKRKKRFIQLRRL